MSEETKEDPSMFQSLQKAVVSRVTRAKTYVTQKIPFLSKEQKPKEGKVSKESKASTDSFTDPPPEEQKNYTVISATITEVVALLQALPSDSKGIRDTLTKANAILEDQRSILLKGDPSARDQSHATAITDVVQSLTKLSADPSNVANVSTVVSMAISTLNTIASTMVQVSVSGVFQKLLSFLQQLIYPLLVLYMASLVANEMIVYPSPIRIFFFIFVVLLCLVFSPALVVLIFYYMIKAAYSYYRNQLEQQEIEVRIFPRIFALLPVTTTPPMSLWGRLFKYPFYYPKTDNDRKELERTNGKEEKKSIMDEYMDALEASFPYGEKVKGSEPFAKRFETVEQNIMHLHSRPVAPSVPPSVAPSAPLLNHVRPNVNRGIAPEIVPVTLPGFLLPSTGKGASPLGSSEGKSVTSGGHRHSRRNGEGWSWNGI
jgi:hypothetical protein